MSCSALSQMDTRKFLDYAILPSESALNYADMLKSLKERGLEQVLIFASDGLVGLPDEVQSEFPRAKHQSCWVHLMRAVSRLVRPSDRKVILDALKRVYWQEDTALARQELAAFLNSYGTKYKRLHKLFQNAASLFSFYEFPKSIRQTIYTSNLIENNNKGFRHKAELKEQFPNEDSLERFACMVYCDYNRRFSGKAHRGFQEAYPELLEMFAD